VGAHRFDAGSLALNLVATVGRRFGGGPVERLDSPARLRDWLTGVGLTVSASLAEEDLARARSLREHLDELFRSVLAGRRPPAAVLQHINAAAAAAVPQLHTTSGGVALAPTPSGGHAFDPVLALVAADAVRIVAGNERLALRSCHADDCQMLFLALGRRERRWCSSERCGNRSRVAAHRTRAARLTSR
jgi:predicted RNA-binding Zn ribbon-like protein